MANLFKGFKQVTLGKFEPLFKKATNPQASDEEKNAVLGYIWFVRTPADGAKLTANDVIAEGNSDSNLLNDSYDIYFGTKHYGHYMKGELPALAEALAAIKTSIGLGENFTYIPSPEALETALDKKFEQTKGKHTVKEAIDLIYTDFDAYKASNDAALNKAAVDIVYTKSDDSFEGKAKGHPSLKLKLKDKTFTTPIDIYDFIKDGMIKSVTLEGNGENKVIRFTWNTDSGDQVTDIKLTDVFQAFTSSDGSIIVTGNDIKVAKVTFDKSFASKKIPVAGGPLANLAGVAELFPHGISTEMPLQEVLMTLFCKEEWPTLSKTTASLVTSVSAPIITMSTSTVEVGTSVPYSISCGASSATATANKMEGFTYGYSAEDKDGAAREGDATEMVGTKGEITKTSTERTLTPNGFGQSPVTAANPTISGNRVATVGTNSISATNTSDTYSCVFGEVPSKYIISNLGNTKEHQSDNLAGGTKTTDVKTSSSASKSFKGDYKYFEGYADVVPTTKDGLIKLNHKSGWIGSGVSLGSKGVELGTVPGQKTHCIAVPDGHKLVGITNGFDLESIDSYPEVSTVAYALADGNSVNYHIYAQFCAGDFKYNTITLK